MAHGARFWGVSASAKRHTDADGKLAIGSVTTRRPTRTARRAPHERGRRDGRAGAASGAGETAPIVAPDPARPTDESTGAWLGQAPRRWRRNTPTRTASRAPSATSTPGAARRAPHERGTTRRGAEVRSARGHRRNAAAPAAVARARRPRRAPTTTGAGRRRRRGPRAGAARRRGRLGLGAATAVISKIHYTPHYPTIGADPLLNRSTASSTLSPATAAGKSRVLQRRRHAPRIIQTRAPLAHLPHEHALLVDELRRAPLGARPSRRGGSHRGPRRARGLERRVAPRVGGEPRRRGVGRLLFL